MTALDVTASGHDRLRIDVTCAATDTDHAEKIVEALRGLEGIAVHKVSDRTFLMHLGGTIEMASKHPIRNRDDLSMVYTPGVARVCEAIVANPEDARRLTVKRNSVAVVTDGSAVLGLGNIGPGRGAAGHGGQGCPVQAVRRYRRLAAVPGHPGPRRDRRHRQGGLARLRRDQPRGHLRAALLRDRGAAARDARHPGLPRRPARHRHRRARVADQRAPCRGEGPRRRAGGDVRCGRSGYGDPPPAARSRRPRRGRGRRRGGHPPRRAPGCTSR